MLLPTWDFFIILFFVIMVSYGFLLKRNKIVVLLVSSYIALAATSEIGGQVAKFFSKFTKTLEVGGAAGISLTTIKIIFFAILIVILTVYGEYLSKSEERMGSAKSFILTGLYGFLSAGLILSSIVFFLDEGLRTGLLAQSSLAGQVLDLRFWWLILPIAIMIISGFLGERKSGEVK